VKGLHAGEFQGLAEVAHIINSPFNESFTRVAANPTGNRVVGTSERQNGKNDCETDPSVSD